MNKMNCWFVFILIVLNILLAAYATPVTDLGDEPAYILLSKAFLGEASSLNLQHRSPLYSIIMAGFMLIFKAPVLYKVMVIFQYLLVAVTAWLVYLLFRRLFKRKELAMLVALLFNLSFSTIYFANILLTEILTVFLLIISVYLLLWAYDRSTHSRIISLGVAVGLLSLARFNAIPLIATFVVLLGYVLFIQKIAIKKWIFFMGLFLFSYALIINLWCLCNYQHNGVYRIFPNANVGIPKSPRNITIASIHPGNTVSEKSKPVLEIFLKARETYLARDVAVGKGSFSSLDKSGVLKGLYSGYAIYTLALPALRLHFKPSETVSQSDISTELDVFFKEIATQNKGFLLKFRFLSLLSSFRPGAGGTLPGKYGNINLNILPATAFNFYKLIFVFVSVFVFIAFFIFLVGTAKSGFKPDITLLTVFFIIFSFWGINFVFFTVGDASRFKFPAEPLIIGLFVYYFNECIRLLKNWKIKKRYE